MNPMLALAEEPSVLVEEPVKEAMVSGPMGSNIIVYDVSRNEAVLVMGVAEDPVPLAAELIPSGDYVMITTTDQNGCNTLSLEACRGAGGFVEENAFQVTRSALSTVISPPELGI